jgi:UTP--glucose-1-phosphate uridylyltransferase
MRIPSKKEDHFINQGGCMKAVIPCAGLGTRFLPVTKAVPKELLPIVDTPVIHLIIEEAIKAGITSVVFITAKGKSAIEDYFDYAPELEFELKFKGKEELFKQVQSIADLTQVITVRQKKPLGLGHAVYCARNVVGNETFDVILGDDLVDSARPAIGQLIEVHDQTGKGVVALKEVPDEDIPKFGIVKPGKRDGSVVEVEGVVEKPSINEAPSNLAIIGRYVLNPSTMLDLKDLRPHGPTGEIQLTDALHLEAQRGELLGCLVEGERFDAGNRLEFLKAVVVYGLKRSDIGKPLKDFLKKRLSDL